MSHQKHIIKRKEYGDGTVVLEEEQQGGWEWHALKLSTYKKTKKESLHANEDSLRKAHEPAKKTATHLKLGKKQKNKKCS